MASRLSRKEKLIQIGANNSLLCVIGIYEGKGLSGITTMRKLYGLPVRHPREKHKGKKSERFFQNHIALGADGIRGSL